MTDGYGVQESWAKYRIGCSLPIHYIMYAQMLLDY